MADEERPTNGGGFDDWLEEEPGPDTDPYAALAADDDEAEISEWMAFTEAAAEPTTGDTPAAASDSVEHPADEPADEATDKPTDEATDEPTGQPADADEPTDAPTADPSATEEPLAGEQATGDLDSAEPIAEGPAADEPTEELLISAPDPAAADVVAATSVDVAEFDGGGRPDTEEIPIITGAPDTVVTDAVSSDSESPDTATDEPTMVDDAASPDAAGDDVPVDAVPAEAMPTDDDGLPEAEALDVEDTGEMPVVGGRAVDHGEDIHDDTGELDPVPGHGDGPGVFDLDADESDVGPDGGFDLSQGDYLATATREHAGLAAAIAEAETSETEQVALAAPIPGLETTVVGFEDVVEAEGHTKARARASGDLLARVVTGVILIAAVGVSLLYRPALVALATVVFVVGAGEFYTALRRSGRQPIALFGFLGILGASVGGFVWGAVAIPTSFLLVTALLLLFYAVVPGKPDPMANVALTVTVMVWAGLGSFAMMIIESDDFRPLVLGVVLTVALMDIAQYFVGRGLGRHPLSPWVSPKKTVEGLVGGVIVAFALGALLHFVPPFELTSGLAVGAAVAVLSPLGDLAMSAAKRALGIKDMGSILPGHGGFLDRIDGLLFVIPAVWAIFVWAGLI